METDLRSSWGSERSADISGWQALQARLREEAGHTHQLPSSASAGCLPMLEDSEHGQLQQHQHQHLERGAGAAQPAAPRHAARAPAATADGDLNGAASLRSSLDGGPTCCERQTSMLPLRATMRSSQWHSHLSFPPLEGDGASPDPLLGGQGAGSSGGSRQRSRSSNPVSQGAGLAG
jgi:hypothetical protein